MNSLSPIGEQFRAALGVARTFRVREKKQLDTLEKVHVVGAGGVLTSAYEQLRNAAENTEEHLLLQNAIRRFYRQLLLTRSHKELASSGDEIITELTLAGYLSNDSISTLQVRAIGSLATEYGELLASMQKHRIPSEKALRWVLDMLSVGVERILNSRAEDDAFIQFCYEYFRATIDADRVSHADDAKEYEIALFVAIHRALLKSDHAVIRADLMRRYQVKPNDVKQFIKHSQHFDDIFSAKLTEKLYRVVDRQAAPERIVRRMIHRDGLNLDQLMPEKSQFLSQFETQVQREYTLTKSRLRRAIFKSIVFLFITKVIIGVSIEVPYDKIVHGQVIWLPLIVNLLFPPVYMALLSLTLRLPNRANTRALSDRITAILYSSDKTVAINITPYNDTKHSRRFNAVYVLFGIALIGLISWWLMMIQFSVLHLVIFFIFLSTASFLGFRLSRMIRELEVVTSQQTGLTFIRDLFYLPFVVIGRWLSDRYAKVNIVTLLLDMVIELPLKTILRLVRQWAVFINARKDEI